MLKSMIFCGEPRFVRNELEKFLENAKLSPKQIKRLDLVSQGTPNEFIVVTVVLQYTNTAPKSVRHTPRGTASLCDVHLTLANEPTLMHSKLSNDQTALLAEKKVVAQALTSIIDPRGLCAALCWIAITARKA